MVRSVIHLALLFATVAAAPALAQPGTKGKELRAEITRGTVYAMGVEGPASAEAALGAGYRVLFLSGSWVTKVVHNKPDIGFYTAEDALTQSRKILAQHPDAVLIADVDGGFGKQADATHAKQNIQAAVDAAIALEKAGVAGIVIDDQNPLDRKAEVDPGKTVISRESMAEMIRSIRAAVSADFVIVGRTAAESQAEALSRSTMLKTAGSDLVIVEAINDKSAELTTLRSRENLELTTIQLDKGEAEPWTRSLHEKMGVKVVLLANALRKRWPNNTADLNAYNLKLDLRLAGCGAGH